MTNATAVIGAGSFGTALAIQLARRGSPTLLWGRDADKLASMQAARANTQYLPGCHLPIKLHAGADPPAAVRDAADLERDERAAGTACARTSTSRSPPDHNKKNNY